MVENVIIPEINKYYLVFENTGSVLLYYVPPVYYTKWDMKPIALSFSLNKSSYSEFMPSLIPSLKFVAENKKITIYENKFDASGLGRATLEGTYDIDEISGTFVKEKLSNFFKALFSTE